MLTLWGEWLFLPASASREIEVSFFFLLPNNFLKGWNLPPFFLSADYRINTRCSLTGLHPGASEQITAGLPQPRELGQRAAIAGNGRPSPVPGMPGPALSTHSQAETSQERRERLPQAPNEHLGRREGVLSLKAQHPSHRPHRGGVCFLEQSGWPVPFSTAEAEITHKPHGCVGKCVCVCIISSEKHSFSLCTQKKTANSWYKRCPPSPYSSSLSLLSPFKTAAKSPTGIVNEHFSIHCFIRPGPRLPASTAYRYCG